MNYRLLAIVGPAASTAAGQEPKRVRLHVRRTGRRVSQDRVRFALRSAPSPFRTRVKGG